VVLAKEEAMSILKTELEKGKRARDLERALAGYKELNKIDKDVTKITGISGGVDVLTIDQPQKGEE
jgi:hypothetical protein